MLEMSAHLVFAHLTTERAALYRAVLGAFVRAKQRFALHLRPGDVERALAADARDSDLSGLGSALAQLVEWGNLEAHPDTADVTSVEEFYRPRYLYQLTVAGEAAERALQLFDDAMRARGELQSVALTDIRQLLEELLETASGDPIDGGKAHRTLLALRGRFEELTARAQAFMSSLQRTIDLHGLTVDALVTYKESLIDYLERFIGDLLLATAEIAEILYKLDERNVGRLVAAVAAREMTDALAPTAAERAAATEIWQGRWRGLRGWFIPHEGEPSQAEVLRHRARAAIPALLSAVASFNDRRVARSDRAADLRALALWFAESETDDEAHRLWRAAFGLSPARHLSIDDEALAAREETAVPAQTSWLEAPPIGISPRLRESGRFTRPGPASRVIDRSAEKAILSRILEEETAQIEAARRRLATGRPTRLSEIGALGRAEFDLLLDLLGEAIAGRARPGDVVETASGDGSLAIRLAPPPDGPDAPPARIETATGALYAPDFVVTITDSLGASEGRPAS
jgi:uncharacterized protein (TIGR02677 family)